MTDGLNPDADEAPGPSSTPVAGGDNGKSGGSTAEDESNSSGIPPVMAKLGEAGNAFVLSEGASFIYGVIGNSAMSKARLVVLRGGVAEELDTQILQNTSTREGKPVLRPRTERSFLSSQYVVGEDRGYDLTVTKYKKNIRYTVSIFP